MKIVYVYPHFYTLAGTERVLIDKMNNLAENGKYEVVLVTIEQGNHIINFPLSHKVKHYDLDIRYYEMYRSNILYRQYKKFCLNRRFQKRFDDLMSVIIPDIVIATTYNSRVLSVITNCTTPYKRVLESHIEKKFLHLNGPMTQFNPICSIKRYVGMKMLESKVSKFDVLVALNRIDADDWKPHIKTEVIVNVVHLNPLQRYSDQNSKRAIFVGRLTQQKGLPFLFDIWKIVFSKHPNWHLDIFGDGDMRNWVVSKSNLLGMNIHVHEPVIDIFEHYVNSSILLLTSLYEPFGLVIPEAMSCGLPVVAFDCPDGPRCIIEDGVDGFLIDSMDVDLFSERVCQLIEDKNKRVEMGMAGVKSSQRFRSDVIIPQWEALFESIKSKD